MVFDRKKKIKKKKKNEIKKTLKFLLQKHNLLLKFNIIFKSFGFNFHSTFGEFIFHLSDCSGESRVKDLEKVQTDIGNFPFSFVV